MQVVLLQANLNMDINSPLNIQELIHLPNNLILRPLHHIVVYSVIVKVTKKPFWLGLIILEQEEN